MVPLSLLLNFKGYGSNNFKRERQQVGPGNKKSPSRYLLLLVLLKAQAKPRKGNISYQLYLLIKWF